MHILDYSDFTVVIPTLNERENIGLLIGHLLSSYKGISVVVADGGSTDGTDAIVKKITLRNRLVRFLKNPSSKKKRSVTASIKDGIISSRTKFAISMDADMQHPYTAIKDIARLLNQGNKLVPGVRIGSSNWGFDRVVIAKVLADIGYLFLVLRGKERCRDVSTGFFGIDRDLFTRTYNENKNRYVIDGIRVFYDTLKCIDHGRYRIAEVPFIFEGRHVGTSKMGFRQGIKAMQSFIT